MHVSVCYLILIVLGMSIELKQSFKDAWPRKFWFLREPSVYRIVRGGLLLVEFG